MLSAVVTMLTATVGFGLRALLVGRLRTKAELDLLREQHSKDLQAMTDDRDFYRSMALRAVAAAEQMTEDRV